MGNMKVEIDGTVVDVGDAVTPGLLDASREEVGRLKAGFTSQVVFDWEDPECDLIAAVGQIQDLLDDLLQRGKI